MNDMVLTRPVNNRNCLLQEAMLSTTIRLPSLTQQGKSSSKLPRARGERKKKQQWMTQISLMVKSPQCSVMPRLCLGKLLQFSVIVKNQAVYCWLPPATAWQSMFKQLHRAHSHNERGFSFTNAEVLCWSGMVIPSGGQGGKGGKTGRRAMGVWARGLLQAEWRPRDGWGSATPSNIAASFPIGCTLHSAGKDFMLCIVCQNTFRKAAAGKAPYTAYCITFWKSVEGDMAGEAHRST